MSKVVENRNSKLRPEKKTYTTALEKPKEEQSLTPYNRNHPETETNFNRFK